MHRQYTEERKRLAETLTEFRRRAQMGSDKFASRVRATKARTGKRVVMIEGLELGARVVPGYFSQLHELNR